MKRTGTHLPWVILVYDAAGVKAQDSRNANDWNPVLIGSSARQKFDPHQRIRTIPVLNPAMCFVKQPAFSRPHPRHLVGRFDRPGDERVADRRFDPGRKDHEHAEREQAH
jgi:hypothetical protein